MPPTLILGKILANAVLATYVFTETVLANLKWSCHSCSGQAMDPGPQGNSWLS